PLSYSRSKSSSMGVEGEGFEPSKAKPADLQSAPFVHSGTPPARYEFRILELARGLEPPTASLQMRCSTIELRQLSSVQRMPRERGRARRAQCTCAPPERQRRSGTSRGLRTPNLLLSSRRIRRSRARSRT